MKTTVLVILSLLLLVGASSAFFYRSNEEETRLSTLLTKNAGDPATVTPFELAVTYIAQKELQDQARSQSPDSNEPKAGVPEPGFATSSQKPDPLASLFKQGILEDLVENPEDGSVKDPGAATAKLKEALETVDRKQFPLERTFLYARIGDLNSNQPREKEEIKKQILTELTTPNPTSPSSQDSPQPDPLGKPQESASVDPFYSLVTHRMYLELADPNEAMEGTLAALAPQESTVKLQMASSFIKKFPLQEPALFESASARNIDLSLLKAPLQTPLPQSPGPSPASQRENSGENPKLADPDPAKASADQPNENPQPNQEQL